MVGDIISERWARSSRNGWAASFRNHGRLAPESAAYEVLPGNTADCTTLSEFLRKIEAQYGKAERIWVMDRGIPTEDTLAQMRRADPPIYYLVGTPKGRLGKLEKSLLGEPWQAVREGVDV